jgi:hypothetical protein
MVLNEIKAVHGEQTVPVLHVFPVLPVSAAVEVGRVWMPKADLPLVVYDQNRTLNGFIRTVQIGASENRESVAGSAAASGGITS